MVESGKMEDECGGFEGVGGMRDGSFALPMKRTAWDRLRNWVALPGESADDTHRKALLLPCVALAACLHILALVSSCFLRDFNMAVFQSVELTISSLTAAKIVVTRRLTQAEMELWVGMYVVISPWCGSVVTYGQDDRWAISIIIADILLLLKARATYTRLVLCFSITMIVVLRLEDAFRFGLYDAIPGSSMYDRPEAKGARTGLSVMFQQVAVFSIDFYLTHMFAHGMHTEYKKNMEAVALAEEVAQTMVDFDLSGADELLQNTSLSIGDPFRKLLSNLHAYRPYLPDTLFTSNKSMSVCTEAPGANGYVTMVFTDVESSTRLWEKNFEAMKESLKIHDAVMRGCIAANGGYEVKTVGDAFMVAFDTAESACRFAVSLQLALYNAPWPEELLELDSCAPVEGAWRGLRVRIGVHTGEADLQYNPVTGRADYYGPTVNIAARMEGRCPPGGVAVTPTVMRDLQYGLAGLGDPVVLDGGMVTLRGVSGELRVGVLVPRELTERAAHLQAWLAEGRNRGPFAPLSPGRRRDRPVGEPGDAPAQRVAGGIAPATLIQQLTETSLTVCNALVDLESLEGWESCIPRVVAMVVELAEATGGKLHAVQGGVFVVVWVHHDPETHHQQAVRFCERLQLESEVHGWDSHVHCGVVSGKDLHGCVGTKSHRFITTFGKCTTEAGELAREALRLRKSALFSTTHDLQHLMARMEKLKRNSGGGGAPRSGGRGRGERGGAFQLQSPSMIPDNLNTVFEELDLPPTFAMARPHCTSVTNPLLG